jgi:hypothetical protein
MVATDLSLISAAVAAAGGSCFSAHLSAESLSSCDIAATINQVFQFSISLGAVLAMLRIAYAGHLYMGSADMWSNKTKAKEVFTDAIVGLLLLLAIWLIIRQINPCILDLSVFEKGALSSQCHRTRA